MKFSPLKLNLGANIIGVGVQLINQLLLVPFYLSFWDTDLYSDWIVLTAFTSFFTLSNRGLNTVTNNAFVIEYSRGDYQKCKSLIANNAILIIGVCIILLALCFSFFVFVDITSFLSLSAMGANTALAVLISLLLNVFLTMFGAVYDSSYRATQHTHESVLLSQCSLLALSIGTILILVFKAPIIYLAIFYPVPALLITVYKIKRCTRYFEYVFAFKDLDWRLFKTMLLPSFTYMGIPTGHAIVYQGFTLIVNSVFGPELVVLYNTTRTLSNFMKTAISTLLQAIWPEFSIAYGKQDTKRMKSLYRKGFYVTSIFTIVASLFLLVFGSFIYNIWTRGELQFDLGLMGAFLIVAFIYILWQNSSVALSATNKHSSFAMYYLLLSSISIGIAYVIGRQFNNLSLVVYSQLVINIPLFIYGLKQSVRLIGDNTRELLWGIIPFITQTTTRVIGRKNDSFINKK